MKRSWRLYQELLILTCFTEEKFVTGCVARRLWYTYHGANRSYPVTDFSPVKQVNINVPWY